MKIKIALSDEELIDLHSGLKTLCNLLPKGSPATVPLEKLNLKIFNALHYSVMTQALKKHASPWQRFRAWLKFNSAEAFGWLLAAAFIACMLVGAVLHFGDDE